MPAFDYADAPYPIRADLIDAYQYAWQQLAQPGTWWSGTERVAIADECRLALTCEFCRSRKQALSPFAPLEGQHQTHGILPETVVDLVHRLTTDPSRLTQSWVEQLCRERVSTGQYVEAISVVITTMCIDSFNRALGMPPEPLPAPQSGEPSRYVPANTETTTAWVPMITQPAAAETDLWPGLANVPNVIRALSYVPDAVRLWLRLSQAQYIEGKDIPNPRAEGGRAISRAQIEFIAARVSAINDCFY